MAWACVFHQSVGDLSDLQTWLLTPLPNDSVMARSLCCKLQGIQWSSIVLGISATISYLQASGGSWSFSYGGRPSFTYCILCESNCLKRRNRWSLHKRCSALHGFRWIRLTSFDSLETPCPSVQLWRKDLYHLLPMKHRKNSKNKPKCCGVAGLGHPVIMFFWHVTGKELLKDIKR